MKSLPEIKTYQPRVVIPKQEKQTWTSKRLQRCFSLPLDLDGYSLGKLRELNEELALEISAVNDYYKQTCKRSNRALVSAAKLQYELRRLRSRRKFLIQIKDEVIALLRKEKAKRQEKNEITFTDCVRSACHEILEPELLTQVMSLAREKHARILEEMAPDTSIDACSL